MATIGQAATEALTNRQDLRTIQVRDSKIRVREGRLRELLMQAFNKIAYEQSKVKDKSTVEQKKIIAQMANWLSVDNVDSHKWVLMIGGIGNGKTTILKAMHYLVAWLSTTENGIYQEGVKYSYSYITAAELCELYKEDKNEFSLVKNTRMVFLDDVGAEPRMQLNWGNEEHPIAEFLMYRYNRQLPTVMTTNLPPAKNGEQSQFAVHYGLRVTDRLNEMCLKVKFTDKSFR